MSNRPASRHQIHVGDAPSLGGDRGQINGTEPRLSLNLILPQALDMLRQPDLRDEAVAALIRLGDAAIPALLDLMHDPERPVRHAAAWAVGRLRDRSSARTLIRAAEWTAPYANANGDGAAIQSLLHALRIGSRPTRVAVMVVLGRLGERRAIPDLLEQLGDDYGLGRLAAIWALGRIGHTAALPHLADALEDSDPLLHSAAAAAIAEIEQSVQQSIMPALDDSSAGVVEQITLGDI